MSGADVDALFRRQSSGELLSAEQMSQNANLATRRQLEQQQNSPDIAQQLEQRTGSFSNLAACWTGTAGGYHALGGGQHPKTCSTSPQTPQQYRLRSSMPIAQVCHS